VKRIGQVTERLGVSAAKPFTAELERKGQGKCCRKRLFYARGGKAIDFVIV